MVGKKNEYEFLKLNNIQIEDDENEEIDDELDFSNVLIMIRYIKIEDSNKRDAELTFKSINSGNKVFLALESGEKPTNKKVIKSSQNNSLDNLINENEITQEHYNQFSEILISDDKEIDFELFGKFIGKTDKIYTTINLNQYLMLVYTNKS